MNLVTSQGCHEGQGYLFGRPMTGNAIRARREIPIILAQMAA
jgi:EAL domain-containing protein (putative c-di-GMP-specific phosphodiesterase class I)